MHPKARLGRHKSNQQPKAAPSFPTMSRTATATATWAFDWELVGVPPDMPRDLQVNMVFYPDLRVVEDTFPLWKTAHAQDGACSMVAPGVAEALEALAGEEDAAPALIGAVERRARASFKFGRYLHR